MDDGLASPPDGAGAGTANGAAGEAREFRSRLSHGRTRFLAHVVERALETGRRSAGDFLRHFPPEVLMEGLRNRPELRARILTPTTGIKERVALKKSPESAADDLLIALVEGETSAETVVTLFHADDRVRYLSHHALWAFVAEGDFWKGGDGIELEIAKSNVAYIIDRAIEESMITSRDVVDGVTVEKIAELLPRAELGWILQAALGRGREKKPFRDEDLLGEAPVSVLADHVPLATLWESVIIPRIAATHDLVVAEAAPEPPAILTPAPDGGLEFGDETTMNGNLDPEAQKVVEAEVAARGKR